MIAILPPLLIFSNGRHDDIPIVIGLMIAPPMMIAAASRALKTRAVAGEANASPDALSAKSRKTRLVSIVGFIVFPQLVQPALLDNALRLKAMAAGSEDAAGIAGPAKTARIITSISLVLIGTAGVLSVLMAIVDSIT